MINKLIKILFSHPRDRSHLFLLLFMQEKNVHIVVVGIGKKVYPEELKKIAGSNVYLVDKFGQLMDHVKKIEESICSKFIYTLRGD